MLIPSEYKIWKSLQFHKNLIQKAETMLLQWHATSEYKPTNFLAHYSVIIDMTESQAESDTAVTPATEHLSFPYTLVRKSRNSCHTFVVSTSTDID